ncbi:DUF2194 domain-containing protein [Mesonia sp.]|uniref:DUF2194 domain-containing protein n=1 Tax=Mesonia sp. TaxID=1960830 RepID=UPI00176D3DB5|nr:DUF2194 domain-containing protein [Mesonia sp.]HIB38261.1 DUF2194 domain-containing protein [Mesonia sp.]HIO25984.1 DUF2194 domain-containing protein [Flavobacteriaceae bacterium]
MKQNYPHILLWFCLTILLGLVSCKKENIYPKFKSKEPTKQVVYPEYSKNPLVEYILYTPNEESENCHDHIRKTLDYAKIPFNAINLKDFNKKEKISKSTRVVVIFDIGVLNNSAYQKLLKFIAKGGTVFLPNYSSDEKFGFLAGVKSDAGYNIDKEATGYNFKMSFLPGMKNNVFRNKIPHFGLKRENFREDINVWATAYSDANYPTIIHNQLGNGHVIAFNSSQFSERQDRGMFFASILMGLENVPYSIANVSSIFLDDFPAPLYDIYAETVKSEMNLSQAQFYKNVWWPDMIKLAKEENLIYSTYPCFDYRNITEPPFLYKEWDHKSTTLKENASDAPDFLMNRALKEDVEIGLHGYNHVSLLKEDWPNKDFMVLALNSAEKKWISSGYGKLPRTYVPPSNHIDSLGFTALQQAIPTIRYNSSLYLGDFEDGGGREFDPEPYNSHFYNFPRITSGYDLDSENQFLQHSLYLYTGIWSHFIHPDDVFQVPSENNLSHGDYGYRNSNRLGWRNSKDKKLGFLPIFRNYIQKTNKIYPFIKYETVINAAKHTENWRNSKVEYIFKEDSVKVNSTLNVNENYWFTYIPKDKITNTEEFLNSKKLKFSKREFLQGYLLNIKTNKKQLSLPYCNKNNAENSLVEKQILSNYATYLSNFEDIQDEYSDIPTQERIASLQQKLNSSSLTYEEWQDLYKLLGWENREFEIWTLLENSFQENPSKQYVSLSRLFTQNSDYPNLETRKRWMLRQAIYFEEEPELKLQYLSQFKKDSIPDNFTISAENVVEIIVAEENEQTQEEYLYGLIEHQPELAKEVLTLLSPCAGFGNNLSESIAWYYIQHKNYDQAISWSNCTSNIAEEEITEWRLANGEFLFLKQKDFPRYIEFLLQNKPKFALKEVINLNSCEGFGLNSQATDLAYAFGEQGSFRKALIWSECAKNFPENDRLQWLYELGDLQKLEAEYFSYIEAHPEDEAIKATMAQLYFYANKFDKAWMLASTLKDSPEKNQLQTELNKEVLNIPEKDQFALLDVEPDFFLPDVRKNIEKKKRIQQNDFIETNSELISDLLQPTSLTNIVAYGVRDKKLNSHTFGLTQYNAYALNIDTTSVNRDHYLYGVQYGFKTKERYEKLNYGGSARVEFNQDQDVFYHLTAEASVSKDSLFSSFQLFHRPAITGPAYSLNIYQTQLNIYEEWKINSHWNAIGNLETNHYDDKNVIDAMILANLSYNIPVTKFSSFNPYVEGSGLLGNTDLEQGYPYWSAKERLYGGLGVSYNIKNETKQIDMGIGAAMFLDTFSDSFQRYRGTLSMPVFDYLFVNANAEFFTIENFYSNSFQLGLKYYLNYD